jgi:hypothetical protein
LQLQTNAECTVAAQQQLQSLKDIVGTVKEVVAKCEGATENCIDSKKVEMLEKLASTRLTEELEQVLQKCDQGGLDQALANEARKIAEGDLGIVPGTAASRLKEIAPDMTGLKSLMQEAAATEPGTPVKATPIDAADIDTVATDRINDIIFKYERTPLHLPTLGESGDQMPMSLKLYCNGGSATDAGGNEKMAWLDSEYVPGANYSFDSAVGWDDLDIYDFDSVYKIYEAAEFKVRGGKKGPRSCSSRDLQLYSFRIDKQAEVGGGFQYTPLFESIGGGWDKFAEGVEVLGEGADNDVFSVIRCEPGVALDKKLCFQPTGPALPYPSDFPGFRRVPRGEFGVCLSKKDPETHLKKLSCAARALAVHMKDVRPTPSAQHSASSTLLQIGSDVAWAQSIMTAGSVLAMALRASAFTIELAMTIIDNLVACSLAVITWLGGFAVDVATFPLIPLLGKNHNRKRTAVRNFIVGVFAMPMCVVSSVYSMVSYSFFALTYIMKHIAFFTPQHGSGSMQGSIRQSQAGQRLRCFK